MTRLIITLLLLYSFTSCQDYENEEYVKIENEAISDIIPEITDYQKITKLPQQKNDHLKLFVCNKLDNTTAWTQKPEGYSTGQNGEAYSKERAEENKIEFEEDIDKYVQEEALFFNLKSGKIKKRTLQHTFDLKGLDIEFVEIDNIKNYKLQEGEIGVLFISRIDFNSAFTKGYLHYRFFCGEACAWSSNIEIQKVNWVWKITEYFSGVVA